MAAKERVTITLPADSAEALRKLAAAGRIESVSAYVAESVIDRLERQERAQRIIEGWAREAEAADPAEWARAMAWAQRTDQRGQGAGAAA
ncbi:ribbon-helix-helix protein, CopG family [Streptomyces sp. B1866]|uniref:ribbon-helix-helix protein, CopG family n=1 Tax=Streptomyces sp. B1866 TaxID=3075431 RepID=UPI00288F5BF8|nr:ribbon-helix-helix protein, CopG family [Streptomyces sp. B1866]MDT3396562.1 ribbon-helix-helix protein, CopG family [Streptomyces sp. B1866]